MVSPSVLRCAGPSLALLTALVAVAAPAHGAGDVHTQASRRVGDVTIDGVLDDAGWQAATPTRGFVQRFPDEGKPPTEDTEFRVVYDDEALYVGVRAFDDHPDQIRGLLTRRDQQSASDWILVGVDSYHDRRTAFVFGLNPVGVQLDRLLFNDHEADDSWDAVWSGAASVDDQGWVAELRIPLSQLRFSGHEHQQWGLQLVRSVARTGEESTWSPWPRSGDQIVSVFGTLDDVDDVTPGRRVEILPYMTAGVAATPVDEGDPFTHDVAPRLGAGLDVRYGLTSSLTLTGTINPDFGQVEADPSQVNLSAQELFFAEKRPFFLEGTDIFRYGLAQGGDGGGEGLFYSRRIGAAPHAYGSDVDPDAEWEANPIGTTIYGAAKVGGKVGRGWTVGALEAVTAEETARVQDPGGAKRRVIVEPLTNYAVLRALKDLRGGKSQLNAIVTATNRRLDGTDLAGLLHDQGYAAGLDGTHRFGHDQWSTSFKAYGSYVHGTADAILADKHEIRHLFQRPDATHLHLDPGATSMSGAGLLWDVGRWNHPRLPFGVGGDVRSPGLELNDLGFQHGGDTISQWVWAGYRDNRPGDVLLEWSLESNVWVFSDFEPRIGGYGGNTNVNATFANYWHAGAGINVDLGRWNPGLLRGGPRYHAEDGRNGWISVGTDGRKAVSANLNVNYGWRPISDSWNSNVNASLDIQARSNVDVSLGPSLSYGYEDHQYVDELADAADRSHYVFARLHQVIAALTLRTSWTFTPELSVQLYAQPFIATGGYTEYKEAADTYADAYDDRWRVYGADQLMTDADGNIYVDTDGAAGADIAFGRPDFDFRELRSTLVARWEYRPGSTVFFIWSHGRSSDDDSGDFRLGHDLRALADARGENLVMVKANFWVGI
ncbi:MAG: carbohydrate binding family 9 domain-containing protein [Kofleriaceae bacterium]|nr:carbohydrate binding family 9 domain-containing protein [Myxococcales bacterium]MCB9563372.1 carbohydrate binding family 9 domain-containing protein [Kofleriaceae bacterium]MCB9573662.1 carbohydrate binding family 9 domain-containing protein [Kofleriaceae bacterium]